MKTIFFLLAVMLAVQAPAQSPIKKTIPFQKGQVVRMSFDYPNLIRLSTWDKNEISIEGTVSINGGENNDAFNLETRSEGNTLSIINEINMKNLPHRITVTQDGQKIVFRDRAAFKKYQDENGKSFNRMNEGVEIDILLEIKIPSNTETFIEATYGMVEVKGFSGPLTVKATYGGVDASLTENAIGELKAETNYGHIYSGLDTKVSRDGVREEDFHMVVSAKPGRGPRMSFESPYGNVYLRKLTTN